MILATSLLFVLNERNTTEALNVSTLQELAQTIHSEYYFYDEKELDNEKLLDAAMRGMIMELDDPYAQYYTEDQYKELLNNNAGDYVGLGISVQLPDDVGAKVIIVYAGSPAEAAGLRKGDILIVVNGNKTAGTSLDTLIGYFSDDTAVPDEITYLRDGVETTITVQRASVHIVRVTSSVLEGNIGYIRISEFNGTVASEFQEAIASLKEQGISDLIIDLRDNPGGGLSEVLNVAYQLIPKGEQIVSIRSKSGNERVYKSEGDEQVQMNMAVLVNGNSASASELLTGALKDYGLATIIGTQTFGKGIVQSFFHLGNEGGWAKMTTDAYYTPSGVCIQGIGITPDVVVDLPEELKDTSIDLLDPAQDTQLKAALKLFAQQAAIPKNTNQ